MYLFLELIAEYLVIVLLFCLFKLEINSKKKKFILLGLLLLIFLFSGASYVSKNYEPGIGYIIFLLSLVFSFLTILLVVYNVLCGNKQSKMLSVLIKKDDYELGTTMHPDIILASEGAVIHVANWKHQDEQGQIKIDTIVFPGKYPVESVDINAELQYDEKNNFYVCNYFKKTDNSSPKKYTKEDLHDIILYISILLMPIIITYSQTIKEIPLKENSLLMKIYSADLATILFGLARKLFHHPKDLFTKIMYWFENVCYYIFLIYDIVVIFQIFLSL